MLPKLKIYTLSFLQGELKNYKEILNVLITEIYCKKLKFTTNRDNKY